MHTRCIVCGGGDLAPLVEIPDIPVHCNVVCNTRQEAHAMPRAGLDISVCRGCGHIFNTGFDPERMRYDGAYENALDGSGLFRDYADALADRLIAEHGLHGKDIIEIGCGNGAFLDLLCRKGGNRGVGFDPSAAPREGGANGEDVRVIADYYRQAYEHYKGDLVICRQVLEHIDEPGDFLGLLRSAMKDTSAVLFIEVPNGMYTLDTGHIWDFIYEHCSYFCESSLARLLDDHGLAIRRLAPSYHDQFMCADAVCVQEGETWSSPAKTLQSVPHIATFSTRFYDTVDHWRRTIAAAADAGQTVVAWGAGSKGVTFLNIVDRDLGAVRYIVDINPKKGGKFVAGAGQQIVAPAELPAIEPNLVLLMNPIYLDEVRHQLTGLGLSPEIQVVSETGHGIPALTAAAS